MAKAKKKKDRKPTPQTLSMEDFLVLTDRIGEMGLGQTEITRDTPHGQLAYPRYLLGWQVACLRWTLPHAEAEYSYPADEIGKMPQWIRSRILRPFRHPVFEAAAIAELVRSMGLSHERHMRTLDTVNVSEVNVFLPGLRGWHHRTSPQWCNAKFCARMCGTCLSCSLATMQLYERGDFTPQVYAKARKIVRSDDWAP